jgi:hypothetical protein
MNHEDLVNVYLEDAEAEHPGVVADQITYLKAIRSTLREEVKSGDWSVTTTNFDGASHNAMRAIPATSRWKACRAAIERLEGNVSAGRVGLIQAKFRGAPY